MHLECKVIVMILSCTNIFGKSKFIILYQDIYLQMSFWFIKTLDLLIYTKKNMTTQQYHCIEIESRNLTGLIFTSMKLQSPKTCYQEIRTIGVGCMTLQNGILILLNKFNSWCHTSNLNACVFLHIRITILAIFHLT